MTLHLMVGLPCSGKTTLARQLEQKYAALRLTPDEWHTRLFGQDLVEQADNNHREVIEALQIHNNRHEIIEALLWEVAARTLVLGVDVILDYGFWVRSQRDDLRVLAAEAGTDLKIHFLNVPDEVLLERLAIRNAQLPAGVFRIPETMLKEWLLIFEPPFQEELAYTCVYPSSSEQ